MNNMKNIMGIVLLTACTNEVPPSGGGGGRMVDAGHVVTVDAEKMTDAAPPPPPPPSIPVLTVENASSFDLVSFSIEECGNPSTTETYTGNLEPGESQNFDLDPGPGCYDFFIEASTGATTTSGDVDVTSAGYTWIIENSGMLVTH